MKRVTIKDIAKIAGVSYSTVSRALAGSPCISDATREKIEQICREEGYYRNALAGSLNANRTNVIGVIVPDVTNPFYSELSLNIEKNAYQNNYNVIMVNSCHPERSISDQFDFLISHRVDGIILANSTNEAFKLVKKYSEIVPTILLGDSFHAVDVTNLCTVSTDNYVGGHLAASYLIEAGHRNILYVGHREASISHQHRFDGFSFAMKKAGLTFDVLENTDSSSSVEAGHVLGKKFCQNLGDITAVFAATDSVALGIMQAADEYGLRIPEDFSLLGYDNILYSSLPTIQLSTIDQRKQKAAEKAVRALVHIIENGMREDDSHRISIPPALVKRSSVKSLK
ncbi:MAG: LacI family DNA-binding transcriptional regulator [Lachnospiraceae bacterium]|nr:LacI family DNA-binding transcriptional regulator [Lachnospiraceae bacterium]